MTDDPKSARLRDSLATLADRAGEATGDERFPRAAGVLRGKQAGRRAMDDADALAFAESLFDAGLVRSRNAACTRAAIMYSPTSIAIDATRARLMKKFRRN